MDYTSFFSHEHCQIQRESKRIVKKKRPLTFCRLLYIVSRYMVLLRLATLAACRSWFVVQGSSFVVHNSSFVDQGSPFVVHGSTSHECQTMNDERHTMNDERRGLKYSEYLIE